MIKVNGYNPVGQTSRTRKTSRASSATSFADILAATETGDAAHSGPVSDVGAADLSNLLLLQEVSEEDHQRKKLVQKGKSLLETLEQLRRQLLMGTLPPHIIRDLHRQLTVHRQLISDPALNDVIDDIELRAAVELAKLEMAMQSPRSEA